jgi:hypothetical protein
MQELDVNTDDVGSHITEYQDIPWSGSLP